MYNKLKANQVRSRINKDGIRTYYIVVEDYNSEFRCMWFRTRLDAPMIIASPDANYRPDRDDPVVLENINILTDTFAEIINLDPTEEVEITEEKK